MQGGDAGGLLGGRDRGYGGGILSLSPCAAKAGGEALAANALEGNRWVAMGLPEESPSALHNRARMMFDSVFHGYGTQISWC